jgi:nicotinamidase/pyrazinamidase
MSNHKRRAFLDIDTQIDFLYPAGALYVPHAERIIPILSKLNRFAVERGIPAASTMCAHSENDIEFQDWPPHCVVGTVGQQKPAALLAGQRLFEKQTTDLFATRAAEQLIADLDADEFVVYGVVTEICVRYAAFGLLERGKKVTVVENAVMQLDDANAAAFWGELRSRGGEIASCDFCTAS